MKSLGGFGIIFFVQSLCAACTAMAELCEGMPAGSGATECKPPHTFVLKKPIQLVDPGEAQENSGMQMQAAPDSGTSFKPSTSEVLPSADHSEMNDAKAAEGEPPSWAHVFSYSKTPREPDLPPVCSDTSSSGNDKPEKYEIDFGGRPGMAEIIWNTFSVKDRLKVYVDNAVVHDTGCVGELKAKEFNIPPGTRRVQVEVIPNCDSTTGTYWKFKVICPPEKGAR